MKLELVPGRDMMLRKLLVRREWEEGLLARRECTPRAGRLVTLSRCSLDWSLINQSDEDGSLLRRPRAVSGRAGGGSALTERSVAKLLSHSADHCDGTVDKCEVIRLSERSGMSSCWRLRLCCWSEGAGVFSCDEASVHEPDEDGG